tara:strand:- start:36 stop:545 length:510 start_codon:yes stop_codon:yes gene_type:complete
MTRGTRGSAFKNKISELERAKDQTPFALGGRGFSLPSDYKQTESAAFIKSGADMSNYGNSKGFLDKFVGGMDSYLDSQKKSDTDKYLDFLRESRDKAQFGGGTGGFASEVAEGLNVYQPPSPNQQMFIPGQEGKGGFNPLGAVVGGIRGFAGGGGPLGAIGGAFGGGFM